MNKLIKINLKKLIRILKIDHLNDKIVILTNYIKKIENQFKKKNCKNRFIFKNRKQISKSYIKSS